MNITNKHYRIYRVLSLALVVILSLGLTISAMAFTWTVPQDAQPGSIVTIYGDNSDPDNAHNWAANETVHVDVIDPQGTLLTCLNAGLDPLTDSEGAWSCEVTLSSDPLVAVGTYTYTATGETSNNSESGNFTDGSIDTYDQCANDLGIGYPPLPPGFCSWVNGNLEKNNSTYDEGDATVQRALVIGLAPNTTHTITFVYGTTRTGGVHAYDYLTKWDWSENWITVADRCDGFTGCTSELDTFLPIATDLNSAFSNGGIGGTPVPQPAGRVFTMRGGTMAVPLQSSYPYAVYPEPTVISGDYTGNGETAITIEFTVGPATGSMCTTDNKGITTCNVAIWFGAHVALTNEWATGGATGISGSPYHVALVNFDGTAIGRRDNQMQAGAVPIGSLILAKTLNIQPGGFDGPFTIHYDCGPAFTGDATVYVGTPVSIDNIPGGTVCTVTEPTLPDPPAGYHFGDPTFDPASGIVTIPNINKATVTVTTNNTLIVNLVDLTVSKTATPSFTRTYTWGISKNVDKTTINIADGGTATFNYQVDVTHDTGTDSAWAVSGKITVSNPNSIAFSGVDVTDAIDNGGSCTVTGGTNVSVPANDKVVLDYSCTYAAAPNPASGTNTATATWTAADYYGTTGTASGTAAVDFSKATPTIVDGSVDVTDTLGGSLGTVLYTDTSPTSFKYSHGFTGDPGGTCTNHDNKATFTTNTSGTTGDASKTVTVCVGKDLTVSKTAVPAFTRTFDWTITKTADKPTVYSAGGGVSGAVNFTVSVVKDAGTDSAWGISGNIHVVNPNDWEAITFDLTDAVPAGICSVTNGTGVVVAASSSVDRAYSCTFAAKPAYNTDITNTATATWVAATYFTPDGTASGTKTFQFTTPTTLVNDAINVFDTYAHSWHFTASGSVTYAKTYTDPAGTCTTHQNTATIAVLGDSSTATVKDCQGADLTVSKTATPTFTRTFDWTILKTADKPTVYSAGGGVSGAVNFTVSVVKDAGTDSAWGISGNIHVVNPNDWEAITFDLTDAVPAGICSVTNGTGVVVAASSSVDRAYSCTFAAKPAYNTDITNTATATWVAATYFTPDGTASGTKTFQFTTPTTLVNDAINVFDTYAHSWHFTASGSVTYAKTYTDPAGTCTTHQNTATIAVLGDSSTATVKDCQGADLTVTKTAVGTFDRTYQWKIAKAVDKTSSTGVGGTATFNYTVLVTETGFTDSNWKVSGNISIKNPNDWEDITTDVADTVNNGGTCKVFDGTTEVTSVTVTKSGTKSLTYTCTYTSQPANYSGTNTATATWVAATYFTPTGSADGTASFTLTKDKTTNETVTITDTFDGTTTTLGTLAATDATPYATVKFTYSHTVPIPDMACKEYTNTAKIVETGQTASQTVKVCKPGLITDTSLCTLVNNQFKLIFTPDQTNGWKLNASNPGQFYFNTFYSGPGGVTIEIKLPYPFVTQGAMPIHVYSNVSFTTNSAGQTCLLPSGEIVGYPTQVTLDSYDPQQFGTQTSVFVYIPVLAPGDFAYINIHIDYGLKGTTGYAKGGPSGNDAVDFLHQTTVLIPDNQTYSFWDSINGDPVITSINSFKKDPGFGGLVLNANTDPVANAKVEIRLQGKLVATVSTDEDGWYMYQFKYTGKPVNFQLTVSAPGYVTKSLSGTMKSNGYIVTIWTLLKP